MSEDEIIWNDRPEWEPHVGWAVADTRWRGWVAEVTLRPEKDPRGVPFSQRYFGVVRTTFDVSEWPEVYGIVEADTAEDAKGLLEELLRAAAAEQPDTVERTMAERLEEFMDFMGVPDGGGR